MAVGVADFGNVEEAGGDRETETPSEEVEEVIEQEVSECTVVEVAPVEAVVTEEVEGVDVPAQEEVVENPAEVEDPDPEPEFLRISPACASCSATAAVAGRRASSRAWAMLAPRMGRLRARVWCPDFPRESSSMVAR